MLEKNLFFENQSTKWRTYVLFYYLYHENI